MKNAPVWPAAPGAGALVAVEGLTKRFFLPAGGLFRRRWPLVAVDGVSFDIARGETLALVGETGSGKSTVARCLLRLLEPSGGRVWFDGQDLLALDRAALRRLRCRMQLVFQDPAAALNPRWRIGPAIREPLVVHGRLRGAAATERVLALLAEVGLDADAYDRFPHQLSGGQRQRAALARALALEPEFLVLDEPVSSLDVSVSAQILNLLADRQRERQTSYLVIAHDLAVVRYLAHRVAVMYLGRVVELAPAEHLYREPLHPYTAALLAAAPVPDPRRGRPRAVLAGELPRAASPPAGCPFHPRCPHPLKDARCRTEVPVLRAVGPERWAACHYAGVAPAREPASAPRPSGASPGGSAR